MTIQELLQNGCVFDLMFLENQYVERGSRCSHRVIVQDCTFSSLMVKVFSEFRTFPDSRVILSNTDIVRALPNLVASRQKITLSYLQCIEGPQRQRRTRPKSTLSQILSFLVASWIIGQYISTRILVTALSKDNLLQIFGAYYKLSSFVMILLNPVDVEISCDGKLAKKLTWKEKYPFFLSCWMHDLIYGIWSTQSVKMLTIKGVLYSFAYFPTNYSPNFSSEMEYLLNFLNLRLPPANDVFSDQSSGWSKKMFILVKNANMSPILTVEQMRLTVFSKKL